MLNQGAGDFHRIARKGDGSTAFDDSVNEVSGTWVTGRRLLSAGGTCLVSSNATLTTNFPSVRRSTRRLQAQARDVPVVIDIPRNDRQAVFQSGGCDHQIDGSPSGVPAGPFQVLSECCRAASYCCRERKDRQGRQQRIKLVPRYRRVGAPKYALPDFHVCKDADRDAVGSETLDEFGSSMHFLQVIDDQVRVEQVGHALAEPLALLSLRVDIAE